MAFIFVMTPLAAAPARNREAEVVLVLDILTIFCTRTAHHNLGRGMVLAGPP